MTNDPRMHGNGTRMVFASISNISSEWSLSNFDELCSCYTLSIGLGIMNQARNTSLLRFMRPAMPDTGQCCDILGDICD